mmetsp:Transcript_32061/g.73232  ORF Transcript_32061/g.73232 Transcript_32061/m.73232 type:complete len:422 (-) Transcript_32061:103-1368(-)
MRAGSLRSHLKALICLSTSWCAFLPPAAAYQAAIQPFGYQVSLTDAGRRNVLARHEAGDSESLSLDQTRRGSYQSSPASAVGQSEDKLQASDCDGRAASAPTATLLESVAFEKPCRVVMGLWPLGIALELLSTLCGTAGKQLIRFSSSEDSTLALKVGFLLIIGIGPLLDLSAYAYAPAALIAPLAAFDVVWNTLMAPFTLHEKLTPWRGGSVVLIFMGTVLAIRNGSRTQLVLTEGVTRQLLDRVQVVAYMACFLCWYFFNCMVLMRRPKGDPLRGFSLGTTAGSCAGNMFSARAACSFIKAAVVQQSLVPCQDWWFVAALLGAAFFSLSDLYFMTKGMQEYEALFMVTLYQGAQVIANSISACMVLGEMQTWPQDRLVAHICCIAIVITGLLVPLLDRGHASWRLQALKDSDQVKGIAS